MRPSREFGGQFTSVVYRAPSGASEPPRALSGCGGLPGEDYRFSSRGPQDTVEGRKNGDSPCRRAERIERALTYCRTASRNRTNRPVAPCPGRSNSPMFVAPMFVAWCAPEELFESGHQDAAVVWKHLRCFHMSAPSRRPNPKSSENLSGNQPPRKIRGGFSSMRRKSVRFPGKRGGMPGVACPSASEAETADWQPVADSGAWARSR